MLIRTVAEAGAVRQTVHPLRPNARGLAGFLAAVLLLPAVVFLVGVAGHTAAVVPTLYMLGAAVIALAYPFAALTGTSIRVCEHGLIVSTLPGKQNRFVIPYATIDPDSGMVHPVPRRGGAWRYTAVAAINEDYPWPEMSKLILATCPVRPRFSFGPPYGRPLNIWGAPYSTHGISFRALHPVLASPWWRTRPATRGHPARAQWVLGAVRPLLNHPDLLPVVIHNDQPVMRWMIGTDRPDKLLVAIEQAMVAAHLPAAQGFAARALGHPYDRPPKDIPADPSLW